MRGRDRSAIAVLVVVITSVALSGCSKSGTKLRSYQDARPLIDELHDGAGRLVDVAQTMGSAGSPELPPLDVERLHRLGALAIEIVRTVKPLDAVTAVERLDTVAADFARLLSGPSGEGGSDLVISPASTQERTRADIRRTPSSPPPGKRGPLYSAFDASLERLAHIAILADPAARAAFAPHRSPADLPAAIPIGRDGRPEPLLHGIKTVDEWRRLIFDDQGRLVVPDPSNDAVAWSAFLAWSGLVNPRYRTAADNIKQEIHVGEAQYSDGHP